MNLKKKKNLAAKTFNVGKERIAFVKSSLKDVGEAITKRDLRDLKEEGAIIIKDKKGRKKNLRKRKKRSTGNIRKKVNKRKQEYVVITRKLRKHVAELKKTKELSREEIKEIRKKIRNKNFKSKANLKQHIKELKQ